MYPHVLYSPCTHLNQCAYVLRLWAKITLNIHIISLKSGGIKGAKNAPEMKDRKLRNISAYCVKTEWADSHTVRDCQGLSL